MKFKDVLKKLSGFAMIGLTALFVSITPVKADIDLSNFKFSFDGVSGDIYSYSAPEWKDNDSSAFINYTHGNQPITMSIVGYSSHIVENIRVQEKTYNPGDYSEIYNWVYENGLPKAVLKGEAAVDSIYEGSGLWSPDTK